MNSLIQTPTNALANSIEFYEKLNFTKISEGESTFVSDGKAIIEINPVRFARAGVKLFAEDWSKEIESIQKRTPVIDIENGHLMSGPSGCWVYLMKGKSPITQKSEEKNSVLGNFAGLSLETISIGHSVEFWNLLGFEITMGGADQGWCVLTNKEGFGVSLMKPNSCPHLFFNPSLTFFNGKENNPKIIAEIRRLNIPISEEITAFNKEGIVDNVIIRDPGGLGFFIFND